MDTRFIRFLFLISVPAFHVLEINAQTTHDSEGRICVASDGEDGVCLQLPQCPRVLSAIARGIRNHTRCGFIGAVELVCCAQEPVNAYTTDSVMKLHTSTVFPPTAHYIESSTRGSHWLPFYVEESAVSTVRPSTTMVVSTTSATVKPRENYVEESENEVEDINLDTNGVNEDVEDRLFLGNTDNNKVSPTLFAFNTLTGFVNAFLGRPPTPQPSPTKFPPPLRPVTKPPTQIYTTPLYVLHNERVVTRKPGSSYPHSMFPSLSSTLKPILNIQPHEIITNKPKPSQEAVRDPNPTSPWPSTYSTNSPGINTVRPEYIFATKPSPLPEVTTRKSFVSVHMPLTEKPSAGGTNTPSALPHPTPSSNENTLVDNVETLLPDSSTEVEFSTIPEIPGLEPVATEIPTWSDTQTLPPDALVLPDVPFVTPIPPDDPSLGLGDFSTLEPSATESSSENIPVGSKSQEACSRYREIPKLTRYIVGGDFAAHGEFPHMVALGFQRPRQAQLTWMCGGSLLNEEYVLTAAHCVKTRFGGPLAVRVGYTNLTADASTGLELAVRASAVHPGYNAATRAHDIALLRLASPVAFSQFVHPACLHAALEPPPGQLLVTGWGSVTPDGSTPTDHLKRALVTPVDDSSCNQTYPKIFRSEMICARSDEVDTCKGDSGGPMQYLEDSNSTVYTVVGVTSFGPNPCATGRPGVYSRVASYLAWIEGVAWPN